MALTSILKEECPKCGKLAVEVSRSKVFSSILIKLQCGHTISTSALKEQDDSIYKAIVSKDGKYLRDYQIDGIKFLEQNNANGILAYEQGLGKTVIAAALLQLHRKKLLPCIVECPTTVTTQWLYEIIRWGCVGPEFLPQIITSSKDKAMPGFGIYIITFDMLKKEEIFEYVPEIKSIIIDECQRIKNHLSDRAKAVQRLVETKKIEHVIPMSGTPIKNHAGEYFTVLNLVDRRRFPHYQRYLDTYCDSYYNGWGTKVGGLKDIARFHEDTKDIIIRRTKDEVLKDLPPLDRKFFHVELDRKFNKAYDKALEELEELLYGDDQGFSVGAAKIAIMSRMRHICGLSKVEECIAFTTEFLISCDRKLTIFCHHQDVADMLIARLSEWCQAGGFEQPLKFHAGLDGTGRANLAAQFKDSPARIMVASTQAAGEGINLQFCSDAVMLERQWNPANEEQAEARFHRFGQENAVSITYMIASGTIDEYFTELVESKRAIVAGALDGKEMEWNQNNLMKELAETLVAKGRKKWTI